MMISTGMGTPSSHSNPYFMGNSIQLPPEGYAGFQIDPETRVSVTSLNVTRFAVRRR